MKIALFTSFGGRIIPDFIMKSETFTFDKNWRVNLVKAIEKLPSEKGYLGDLFPKFERDKEKSYLKIEGLDIFYFKNNKGLFSSIKITDVDTTIPWKVIRYDNGIEDIEYFTGIQIVNEETNECTW